MNDGNMWMKVASARINTAFAYKLLAEFDKALDQANEGLKILDSHFTQCKPEICHALDLTAELHIALGRHSDAQPFVSRSLGLKEAIYPPESPQLINSYNLQGAVNFSAERLADAEASFLKSIKTGVANFGYDRPLNQQLAVSMSNLAGVWRAQEKWQECVEAYAAVKESFEVNFGEDSWMSAQASVDLGLSLIAAGAGEAAREHLVKGLTILVNTSGPDHPSALAAVEGLAKCKETPGAGNLSSGFLIDFFEKIPKIVRKSGVSGDVIILDRRGHVGGGHPFSAIR